MQPSVKSESRKMVVAVFRKEGRSKEKMEGGRSKVIIFTFSENVKMPGQEKAKEVLLASGGN